MKLKKLFKNKVSYFDIFFGIIFLVIIAGVFLFFYRKSEYVDIRVRITDQDVLYANNNPKTWYANRFNKGDKEMDELGRVITEITNTETFNITGENKVVYLDMKIKAVYDRRTKLYSAKGSTLVFGNTIKINLTNVSFIGLITESPSTVNQKDYSEETRRISVIMRGALSLDSGYPITEPEVLLRIKKGDTITDSNGKILAKVVNVVIRPAQRITQTDSGNLLLREDPYFKDATVTLDVLVKKYKGDEFIFDSVPLKFGVIVPLNFPYLSIWPTITDIK
jgi:hypothetical protein